MITKVFSSLWFILVAAVLAAVALAIGVFQYAGTTPEEQAQADLAVLQAEVDAMIPQAQQEEIFQQIESRSQAVETSTTSTTTTTTTTPEETTTSSSSSTTTSTTSTTTTTTLPAGPSMPAADELLGALSVSRLGLEAYPVVAGEHFVHPTKPELSNYSTPKGEELASNATGYLFEDWLDDVAAGYDLQLLAPTPGTGLTFGVGGHQTSHEGPFAGLDELQKGDTAVFSSTWGVTYVYEYQSERNASNDPDDFWGTMRAFEWDSPNEEFMVLYTCDYTNGYADGTAANRYMVGFRLVDQFATPGE